MRTFSIHGLLMLFGLLYALVHALAVPIEFRNDLAQRPLNTPSSFDIPSLEKRAKWKSNPKLKPETKPEPKPDPKPTPKPEPKSTPAPSKKPDSPSSPPSSKEASRPQSTHSPHPTLIKSQSTATQNTQSASSGLTCTKSGKVTICPSSSTTSTSSVKLKVSRPTKAFDPCDLPQVDCFRNFEDFSGVQDDENWETYEKGKTRPEISDKNPRDLNHERELHIESDLDRRLIEKRGDRDYETDIGAGKKIIIESLGYPRPGKLFTGQKANSLNLKPHAYKFKNKDLSDYTIDDLKNSYSGKADWVVEHIIELQSIKMFIEDVVRSGGISGGFFETWWNKNIDYTIFYSRPAASQNTDIADWTPPKPPKPDKWRTLNNLVFNALGSAKNRKDFVLCDATINGYKMRLWSDENPVEETKFRELADNVATGGYSSDIIFSDIRTVIGVFEYFNKPDVQKKLKSAIKSVGAELSAANIAHLTNKQVTNIDLEPLWQKYMEKQLDNVETKGTEWLNEAISYATKAFKKELATLETEQRKLAGISQTQKDQNKKKRLKIEDEVRKLNIALHNAEKKRDDAKDNVEALAKNPKATKSQKEYAKNDFTGAKKSYIEALKTYNLKRIDGYKLDEGQIKQVIAGVKKDQAILAKYKAYKVKMPSAK